MTPCVSITKINKPVIIQHPSSSSVVTYWSCECAEG